MAPTLESIATGELAPRPEHRDAARSGEGLPWLGEPPPIDPDRRYGLAELIDLAQRTNPGTRVAWERAREAAIAIGLVEGAYEPMLAASLMAGYERAVFPIPEVPPLIDSNSFSAETADLVPGLELTWLLYDFGRREAAESLAKSRAVFADAEFNNVTASNFLEHLEHPDIDRCLAEVFRVLRPGGHLILVQPNFALAPRAYFDDYTHRTIHTDVSLADRLGAAGFDMVRVERRFLPLSMRSRLSLGHRLVPLYLRLPWRPLAGQMLLIARRP